MPIDAGHIAPLLKGTYSDRQAVWKVIAEVMLPTFGRGLARLWVREMPCTPQEFGCLVLTELGLRVIGSAGLSPPKGPPPEDFTPWLRTVVMNQARDMVRKAIAEKRSSTRQVEFDEKHMPPPAVESTPLERFDDESRREALASLTKSSPLYVVGLYLWTDPRWVTRDLLAAAAQVTRGHTDSGTGLVRSVDDTLRLLKNHREQLAGGVGRSREAQNLVAWILRSEEPSFETWVSAPARVKSARQTITKWKQRALEKLKVFNAQRDRDDEEGP